MVTQLQILVHVVLTRGEDIGHSRNKDLFNFLETCWFSRKNQWSIIMNDGKTIVCLWIFFSLLLWIFLLFLFNCNNSCSPAPNHCQIFFQPVVVIRVETWNISTLSVTVILWIFFLKTKRLSLVFWSLSVTKLFGSLNCQEAMNLNTSLIFGATEGGITTIEMATPWNKLTLCEPECTKIAHRHCLRLFTADELWQRISSMDHVLFVIAEKTAVR